MLPVDCFNTQGEVLNWKSNQGYQFLFEHFVMSVVLTLLNFPTNEILHCSSFYLSIFKMIDEKDVVAWSAALTCYAQAGNCDGAHSFTCPCVILSVSIESIE